IRLIDKYKTRAHTRVRVRGPSQRGFSGGGAGARTGHVDPGQIGAVGARLAPLWRLVDALTVTLASRVVTRSPAQTLDGRRGRSDDAGNGKEATQLAFRGRHIHHLVGGVPERSGDGQGG